MKTTSKLFLQLLLPLASVSILNAAEDTLSKDPGMVFEENKNQWPEQVRFQADIQGGTLFLEQNTFTYLYKENINWHRDHRNESHGPVTVKFHSFKVNFRNSNPEVQVSGNKRYSWHRNYYLGNDPKKWADNVSVYGQVYYTNLYQNIDMKVYNVEQNLKYDFIVHPGGNVGSINLNYNGPDKIYLENGHLFIKTSIYDLIEQKPYSYQEINGLKIEVPCSYILSDDGKNVSFAISNYNKSFPLVIDPTLIASTYTGSAADNWGFTATYDVAGNIYTGGIVSKNGYPTTSGAFQTTFGGGDTPGPMTYPFDISLTKFNPDGSALLFSTYYGGRGNEQPQSLMVNSNNELYVTGRTASDNFPVTANAYQQTLGGGYDVIVGKFNSTGGLMASTFVGGSGDDAMNIEIDWDKYPSIKYNYTDDGRSEIILDANSNVYVAVCTSSSNFPTAPTGNAYDASLGGTQDACVFAMNSTLSSLIFSTYLGGSGDDAAYGLKLDNSGNVCVTGGTTSTDFPMPTTGTLHSTYQGGLADGFIAVLNNTGTSLLRSTYLGTSAYDQSYLIEIDASGDLYVFGQTKGAYPVTAGVYSNPNSGQFIHKTNGLLTQTIFSTVVGKGGNIPTLSPTAFLVDSCQSIYISGWGRTTNLKNQPDATVDAMTGLPLTANAYQKTTDGGDFYFMVLTPNAKRLWYATYFGENEGTGNGSDHVDGGTSRFDKRAYIYQSCCASCGGTQRFPTTPNAWSRANNGVGPTPTSGINCNNAVVKMDVRVYPVAVANANGKSGCAPHTVNFNNNGSTADDYLWNFGDGSANSTVTSPSHTYTVGTYTVTLFATDTIGVCGVNDTATLIIRVGEPPVLQTSQVDIVCTTGFGSATVTPTGGTSPLTYLWNPSGQTTPIATNLAAGPYTVTVKDAMNCSSTATVTIKQSPPITLSMSSTSTCGTNGSATATPQGGTAPYTYAWSDGQITQTASNLATGTY
ncbi:MAG: PKD domain-containing protein, partial [Bacteroidota bacterium]